MRLCGKLKKNVIMKNNYDEIELPIVFYLVNYLEGKKDILSKCGFTNQYIV
jgi:hypothetical protein